MWERGHLEDLGADGEIVSEWSLKEISWEDIDWNDLAQDRDSGGLL